MLVRLRYATTSNNSNSYGRQFRFAQLAGNKLWALLYTPLPRLFLPPASVRSAGGLSLAKVISV